MKISIKKNDYVRPTEVRNDVVRKVCNYIVSFLDKWEPSNFEIRFQGENPALFLGEKKDECVNYKSMSEVTLTIEESHKNVYNYTRISSSEMRLVFMLLQDAGYYIYSLDEQGWNYVFSKRPYRCMYKAEHVKFKSFID